jgi:hypothetical protein
MLSAPRRMAQLIALALVLLAALAVLVVPAYEGSVAGSSAHAETTSSTVLEVSGPGVLITLVVPLVIAAAPVLTRGRPWLAVSIAAAALLTAFTALALLSIGVFLIPAAVAAIVALFLPVRARRAAAA